MSPTRSLTALVRPSSGAGIHAEHLGDVRAFMSWPDADFDGFTRLDGVDAALSQHAPMEEGVAGPIREFDEAEALFRTEPLHDAVD